MGQENRFSSVSRMRHAVGVFVRNIVAMFRRASPLVLLVPASAVAVVVLGSQTSAAWLVEKHVQEAVAPAILLIALAAAGLFWSSAADFLSRWLFWLVIALFCRELHFYGTNNGIYVAIAGLFWYAARNINRITPLVQSRLGASLLAGAVSTYAASKTFDRAYWSFVRGWPEWQETTEECLETTAHILVLSLVITSYVAWRLTALRGEVVVSPLAMRVRRWILVAALVACGMLALRNPPPLERTQSQRARGGFPPELSSLARVSPSLGPNLYLAGSDEDRKLTLWTFDDAGRPVVVKKLELHATRADGSTLELDDLEDIAWDGRETYYAVASHRHIVPQEDRARITRSHGTECALVRFRLEAAEYGIAVSDAHVVTHELLAKIRELGVFRSIDWRTSQVFSWRHRTRTWQLNIEGLACVDGKLLLGFKDPIEAGRATILSYDPAADTLTVAARPDLGGHGILGLYYDGATDRLLLLSNDPLKHRFGDSSLWVGTRGDAAEAWRFSADRRHVVESESAGMRRKASGIAVADDKLAVCFDSETESPIRVFAIDDIPTLGCEDLSSLSFSTHSEIQSDDKSSHSKVRTPLRR